MSIQQINKEQGISNAIGRLFLFINKLNNPSDGFGSSLFLVDLLNEGLRTSGRLNLLRLHSIRDHNVFNNRPHIIRHNLVSFCSGVYPICLI